jgi:hypothetical protein
MVLKEDLLLAGAGNQVTWVELEVTCSMHGTFQKGSFESSANIVLKVSGKKSFALKGKCNLGI